MVRSFFDPSMIKQMMPKQGLSTTPVFDLSVIMETQRKNAQALTELMQLGMASVQQAVTRQAELMGRMVQDNSSYASTIMTEGTPEQKVQRQADLVRKSYESTVAGAREVNDIITKSGEEAADIINRRVTATLSELKSAFDPKAAKANYNAMKANAEDMQDNAVKVTKAVANTAVKATKKATKKRAA